MVQPQVTAPIEADIGSVPDPYTLNSGDQVILIDEPTLDWVVVDPPQRDSVTHRWYVVLRRKGFRTHVCIERVRKT